MKKNSASMFMLISTLMLLLHILRGPALTFTISGKLPYILYYGTIALYVFCHAYNVIRFFRIKYKK